jgi:hypothetical protein
LAFPPGHDSVTVPFRLAGDRIYLRVSVDGKPPLEFLFDPEGASLLDTSFLARTGLTPDNAGLIWAARISLGGAALAGQIFAVADFTSVEAADGVRPAGLIGWALCREAVVRIDYAMRRLTLLNRRDFRPGADDVPLAVDRASAGLLVQALLDGAALRLTVDVGGQGPVRLNQGAPGVTVPAGALPTVGSMGVDGPLWTRAFRAASLRLGQLILPNPLVEVGGDAGEGNGVIGGATLARLTWTIDAADGVIYVQPNRRTAQPAAADRSGLWVEGTPDGNAAVVAVTPNGPGADAGLEVGDTLTGLDGISVQRMGLAGVRARLCKSGRTRVQLAVKANGKRARTVTLTLTSSE